ncbi:hypothetical protein A5882_003571 [Enterococcus sp. 4E1_DIV0656]|uniref:DUF6036 family nucleotidyltransferase n=1 Tax=Enterococcus sp. 4E1_DIV0656 TaxID=1834180 RepID=UPI000A3AC302|nr:DUF6036 family nucleotidyltransferase [Enterococcus sp. 4E1_DIV0656]OTO09238.1 hypothetical protein A5882_003571 [Enterococcus sp. 4E1_DIV0656]
MNDNMKLFMRKMEKFNEQLANEDISASVILIGGQAGRFLLEDFRMTYDVDFMVKAINDASKASTFRELMFQNDIEDVTVVEVPPLEEIEFQDSIEFSNLTIYIPTIEYFAITKLFSNRPKDEYDLVNIGIIDACDPEKLNEMIHLYKGDVLNVNDPNANFNTLKDFLKSRGIE